MSLLLILIPFLGAAAASMLRGTSMRSVALLVSLANLLVTFIAATAFDPVSGQNFNEFSLAWIPDAGIRFSLGMDGISLLLVFLTNLLAPLIVYSSFSRSFDNESRYYGLVLLMIGALNGVFMAQDGLVFYIFYELALIPIYFI